MISRRLVAAALAAVLSLAGGSVSLQAAPADQPLVVALTQDISTMEPFGMAARFEIAIASHVVQYLTYRNMATGNMDPMLATSWQMQPDKNTWRFRLRPNVKFSNGEAFNAVSVKFSIDTLMTRHKEGKPIGAGAIAAESAEIESVNVVNDTTIDIVSKSPKALMPLFVAQIPMLAPKFHGDSAEADRAKKLVGTGPYVLGEWTKDDKIVLDASPTYWGPRPSIRRIVYRTIPEISNQIAALETGQVHILSGLPIDQARLLTSQRGIRVQTIEGGRRVMVGIKTQDGHKALADRRVRQALNHAVNFDAINKALFMGRGKRMGGVFNPPCDNPAVKPYTYDANRARQLLREAGYGNGLQLDQFITPQGRWVKDVEIAQAVASDLRKVGVTFKEPFQTFEWGIYRQRLIKKELPDLFMQASGGEWECAGEAADLVADAPSNFYRWSNAEYGRLWQQLSGELDMAKRTAIGRRMQQVIRDDAPWIFLYIQLDTYATSDKIDWKPSAREAIHLWNTKWVR